MNIADAINEPTPDARCYASTLWVTPADEAEADENGNHVRRQRTFAMWAPTKKQAREGIKAHAESVGFIKPRTVKGSSKVLALSA